MIKIANRSIGMNEKPFVIAEMSGNHNQSLDRALQIVEAIAASGADAIKIQTYTADSMTLDLSENEFFVEDKTNIWQGKTLYELYDEAHTPLEWHQPIFRKASELGLIAFSTPFDKDAVDFLEELSVPCYKISSFENTDLALIKYAAATGKPLIISTGMAQVSELDETVRAAREGGCKDLILLKCTSTYPATPENTNILTIPHMRELFKCEVGLSDHTLGIGVALASVALGATVIEKHFTLRRADGGVDSTFSMEPHEMEQLVSESERVKQSLGRISYGPTESEMKSLQYRRSIYIVKDINAGEQLTTSNIRAIRPGLGLPVKYLDILLGKRVKRDVSRGTPLSWDLLG